jgi:hypothetical protein
MTLTFPLPVHLVFKTKVFRLPSLKKRKEYEKEAIALYLK